MVAQAIHVQNSSLNNLCKFCSFLSQEDSEKENFNHPLCETENFVVVPSVGAIVPGWLLLVPKSHYLNIGEIPFSEYDELNYVITSVTKILNRHYGTFTIFEHGPVCDGSNVGCGIDHAHLHMVPFSFSYREACAKANLSVVDISDSGNFSSHKILSQNKIPYLYVKEKEDKGIFFTSPNIPSQFFRRIIADSCGKSGSFDYKTDLFIENVGLTISTLASDCIGI